MIYQFFFAERQRPKLFDSPLYRGFGLEPSVNREVTLFPELRTQDNRVQLVEFGGMLQLWQNPPDDGHDWIGFTSYRQLDKSKVLFEDEAEIRHLLGWWDVLGFLPLTFDESLAIQAERHHTGILVFLTECLSGLGRKIPSQFWRLRTGFFASYFICSKVTFNAFMEWLWPCVDFGLSHGDCEYMKSSSKSLGYALERLFIFWYISERKRVLNYPKYKDFCANPW